MRRSGGNFPLESQTVVCIFWASFLLSLLCSVNTAQYELFSAHLLVTYTDPATGNYISKDLSGRFGVSSPTGTEIGKVVHVLTEESMNHGCSPAVNAPLSKNPWIALIQRGNCKFEHKILTAVAKNASAVVIYNHKDEDTLITMDHSVDDVVSVFIHKADGDALATLVDNNVNVTMNISVGEVLTTLTFNENGTSSNHLRLSNLTAVKNINLLVISLSFVVLLIIGLVCLLVYAVRRSKYLQAKNRARDMIFTVDTSSEGKEARVRLLNFYANHNAALPSVSVHQVPMQLQQHVNPDQHGV